MFKVKEVEPRAIFGNHLKAVNALLVPTHTIVAGGFIRDYLHGKAGKDIDIFVTSTVSARALYYAIRFNLPKHEVVHYGGGEELPADYAEMDVHEVSKITFEDGFCIDLIKQVNKNLRSGNNVIALFDADINACYYDPKEKKVYSYLPEEGEKVRAIRPDRINKERMEKFANKYPQYDWTEVLPNRKVKGLYDLWGDVALIDREIQQAIVRREHRARPLNWGAQPNRMIVGDNELEF